MFHRKIILKRVIQVQFNTVRWRRQQLGRRLPVFSEKRAGFFLRQPYFHFTLHTPFDIWEEKGGGYEGKVRALLDLDVGTALHWVLDSLSVLCTAEGKIRVQIKYEARCNAEEVWTFCWRRSSFSSSGFEPWLFYVCNLSSSPNRYVRRQ